MKPSRKYVMLVLKKVMRLSYSRSKFVLADRVYSSLFKQMLDFEMLHVLMPVQELIFGRKILELPMQTPHIIQQLI